MFSVGSDRRNLEDKFSNCSDFMRCLCNFREEIAMTKAYLQK